MAEGELELIKARSTEDGSARVPVSRPSREWVVGDGAAKVVLSVLPLFVAAVIAAGAVFWVAGLAAIGDVNWTAIICLALLTALAERFDWSLYGNSRDSVAFAPMFSAAVLFGLPGVAIVAPVAVLASWGNSTGSMRKGAFNSAVFVLCGAASVGVFQLFGAAGSPANWPDVIGPALLAAGANYAVNTGLVAIAISLDKRQSPIAAWREHFAWLGPHYLALGVLGASIAAAYVSLGAWGFAVFLIPAAMMALSQRQYVDRTAANIEELRNVNAELNARNEQLLDARAQATTDGLTGLANHRSFQEAIRAEIKRSRGSGDYLGLIMLDVDGFKELNDSQGHLAGDRVLRDLGRAIVAVVAPHRAFRYGGDEFAALLPGLSAAQSGELAELVRQTVEELAVECGVTVSVGVASFPDLATTAEELIYTADMAMYWAKSAGKNCVGHWAGLRERRTGLAESLHAERRYGDPPAEIKALVNEMAAGQATAGSRMERCSWYALQLANELDLSDEERSTVGIATLLHDIGNLSIPGAILGKRGSLTTSERDEIRRHSSAGLRILAGLPSLAPAAPAILHHHEHFDGSGYPDGLEGHHIPLASRIVLVVDAFDAMTTDRPYRRALSIEEATNELQRNAGSQFDPMVVEAFLRLLRRSARADVLEATAAS